MSSMDADQPAGPIPLYRPGQAPRAGLPRERQPPVPSEVLGITIFILTEMMFFAGMVSAYTISRAGVPVWPPPGQPRLPLEQTAFNTVALLLSGAALWYAGRQFSRQGPASARAPYLVSLALGGVFVAFQGYEWAMLLGEGLTLTSSTHGSFFYLIVGAHALHVVGGAIVLGVLFGQLVRDQLQTNAFWAARLFWYFVVLLWPLLYWQVYT